MKTCLFRTVTAKWHNLRKALERTGGMMLSGTSQRGRRVQGFSPILYIRGEELRLARGWQAKIKLLIFFQWKMEKNHMKQSKYRVKRFGWIFHRGAKLQILVFFQGKMSPLKLFWIKGRWRISAGRKNSLTVNFEKRTEIVGENFFGRKKTGKIFGKSGSRFWVENGK